MLKMPEKITIAGPVGGLDTIVVMAKGPTRGIAVVAHPNPLQGGTHTNKVVQTCAKSLSQLGYTVYCPNLRGVGASEGEHDYGRGEVEDVLAVIDFAQQQHGTAFAVGVGRVFLWWFCHESCPPTGCSSTVDFAWPCCEPL